MRKLEAMNRPIFKDALQSIIITSDYVEYQESGNSFIVDTLTNFGMTRTDAEQYLIEKGKEQQYASQVYLDCFEEFGAADDFDQYSNDETEFKNARDGLVDALVMALSANFH